MSDNAHWATQLPFFHTCSHNFRQLFMAGLSLVTCHSTHYGDIIGMPSLALPAKDTVIAPAYMYVHVAHALFPAPLKKETACFTHCPEQ